MASIKDGKPKRPMSAYMFFATEERPKVKKIQPAWSILEIAKELGLRWNALLAPQKVKFEAMARKDKERYEREGGGRKERKGPKRPQSAYMFFVQDERGRLVKQHPTWTVPQVGSELGKRWRALNPSQKKKFEVQAQADKGRYEREMGKTPSGDGSTPSGSASPIANASSSASSPIKKEKKDKGSSSKTNSSKAASTKKSSSSKSSKSESPAPNDSKSSKKKTGKTNQNDDAKPKRVKKEAKDKK